MKTAIRIVDTIFEAFRKWAFSVIYISCMESHETIILAFILCCPEPKSESTLL